MGVLRYFQLLLTAAYIPMWDEYIPRLAGTSFCANFLSNDYIYIYESFGAALAKTTAIVAAFVLTIYVTCFLFFNNTKCAQVFISSLP